MRPVREAHGGLAAVMGSTLRLGIGYPEGGEGGRGGVWFDREVEFVQADLQHVGGGGRGSPLEGFRGTGRGIEVILMGRSAAQPPKAASASVTVS
ncbi:hypothetical protein GCM10010425_64480 [Streptomyces spororaveus]|uniref:Uncharacterized protein n=1 Tax=Streptomyces spororaveus TaxID=284039 RepID=A0ABQ3T6X7_9ACTN|nr:hypothetical protein Sspor_16660 [Streptomyces spororaveus]